MSPIFALKAAFSNGSTIVPRPNCPKSPPLLALLSSENSLASSAKSSPLFALFRIFSILTFSADAEESSSSALSFVLIRICLAFTSSPVTYLALLFS